MRNDFATYLRDFVQLFYPRICVACGDHLNGYEETICQKCINDFPYTDDQPQTNYLANQLMPLQPVAGVYSLCYYNRGSAIERCVHALKYRSRKDVGLKLGELLGSRLQTLQLDYHFILPVPLHPKKEAKRGFNQSYLLARGMSNQLNARVNEEILRRTKNTPSQTKKSRTERFNNMNNAFQVKNADAIQGKNILLVDDVITTGSTIISCSSILFNAGAKNIFLASVGKADLF